MRSKMVMWFERVLVDEETGYKRSGAVGHNTSRGGVSSRLRDSNPRLATPLEKCGHQAQPNTCRYCSHEMVFLVLSKNEVLGEDTNSTLPLSVNFLRYRDLLKLPQRALSAPYAQYDRHRDPSSQFFISILLLLSCSLHLVALVSNFH